MINSGFIAVAVATAVCLSVSLAAWIGIQLHLLPCCPLAATFFLAEQGQTEGREGEGRGRAPIGPSGEMRGWAREEEVEVGTKGIQGGTEKGGMKELLRRSQMGMLSFCLSVGRSRTDRQKVIS